MQDLSQRSKTEKKSKQKQGSPTIPLTFRHRQDKLRMDPMEVHEEVG